MRSAVELSDNANPAGPARRSRKTMLMTMEPKP